MHSAVLLQGRKLSLLQVQWVSSYNLCIAFLCFALFWTPSSLCFHTFSPLPIHFLHYNILRRAPSPFLPEKFSFFSAPPLSHLSRFASNENSIPSEISSPEDAEEDFSLSAITGVDNRHLKARLGQTQFEALKADILKSKEKLKRSFAWDVKKEELKPAGEYIQKKMIVDYREPYKLHPSDCGSTEYQIASATARIHYLTEHMKVNKKDFSSKRGLVSIVNHRKRLLIYLARKNITKYEEIRKSFNIRPVVLPMSAQSYSREWTYRLFNNVKKYVKTKKDTQRIEDRKEMMREAFEKRESRRRAEKQVSLQKLPLPLPDDSSPS